MRWALGLCAVLVLGACANTDVAYQQEAICCGAACCRIAGSCYARSDTNPANSCQVCDPSRSQVSFSPIPGCVPTDAGSEAGVLIDSGPPGPEAGVIIDSGPPGPEAGVVTDSGPPPLEAGVDGGAPGDDGGVDSGPAPADSGSTMTDSGTSPTDSGSTMTDSGAPMADGGTDTMDGGCGCSVPSATSPGRAAWLLLVGLVFAWRRRRR